MKKPILKKRLSIIIIATCFPFIHAYSFPEDVGEWIDGRTEFCRQPTNSQNNLDNLILGFVDRDGDCSFDNWDYWDIQVSPADAYYWARVERMDDKYLLRIRTAIDYVGDISIKVRGKQNYGMFRDPTYGNWSSERIIKQTNKYHGLANQVNGNLIVLQGNTNYKYTSNENFDKFQTATSDNSGEIEVFYSNYDNVRQEEYINCTFPAEKYTQDFTITSLAMNKCGWTDPSTAKESTVRLIQIPNKPTASGNGIYYKSGQKTTLQFSNTSDVQGVTYRWSVSPSSLASFNETGATCDITFNNTDGRIYTVKCRAEYNGKVGDWSEEVKLRVEQKPTVDEIIGPNNICYSNISDVIEYKAIANYGDVTWSVSNDDVTLEQVRKTARITVNENVSNFTLTAVSNNGFVSGPVYSKNISVTNTNIPVDFGDITPCSGQGNILINDISPAGGFYYVHGRERTATFYANHCHFQTSNENVNYLETETTSHFGNYYGSDYEYLMTFAGYNEILLRENIISARLIIQLNHPATDIRGTIGSTTSLASDLTSATQYENLKSDLAFEIDDKEIANNTAFEIDVTEIVRNWQYTQIYLDPEPYDILGVNFYTSNNSNALKPKLIITYTTESDRYINTNTPGDTYQITYLNDEGGCTARDNATITIDPKPTLSFTAPDFCAEALPGDLSGGSANMQGSGLYIGDNVSNNQLIANSPGEYSVTYQYTANNGCTSEISRNVTVHPTPAPSINAPDNICGNNLISASITGAYSSINWDINDNSYTGNSVAYLPPTGYFGNITAEATVVDYNGCTNTTQKDINVYELPSLTLEDQEVCDNTTTIYEPDASISDGFLEYQWSNGQNSRDLTININSTQTYSLTVTSIRGCSVSANMQAIALDKPSVTVDDKQACEGESVTMLAEPFRSNWSYRWSNNSPGNQVTYNPINIGTNNVSVLVTDNDNGCSSYITSEIYVYENPAFTLQDQDACYGEMATISAPPGYSSYTWSNGTTGTSSISVTPFNSQTITCEVEDVNGCSSTENMRLTVYTPAQFSLENYNEELFCYGSTATLTAPDGYEYQWSNGSSNQSISFPVYSAGSYSLTTTDDHGCESDDEIFIDVRQLPVVTLNSPTICNGDQASLVATPATYNLYYWNNGQSGSSINVNPNVNTTYELSVTDDLGCTNSFNTNVSVNPLPSFALPDKVACYGDPVTLSIPNGFSSYLWSNGETSSSIEIVANETGIYSCEVTNINGCTKEEEMTLTVRQPQELNMDDINACEGENVELIAPNGFNTYQWSNGVQYQSTSVVANQTTNYTLDVVDQNGCRNSETITVFANPYPVVDMPDIGVNEGDTRIINAPTGYAEYLWSTGHIDESIEVTPTESTQYWVNVTTAKGCAAMDTFLVFVYDLPEISISDKFICNGQELGLEAPEGFVNYLWTIGEDTYNDRIITVTPNRTSMVYLEVENEHGGVGGTSLLVTVKDLPIISCKDTLICHGEQVVLATNPGYESYSWSNGETTSSITVSPNETTTYSIEVVSQNGCRDEKDVKVSVDNPTSNFNASITSVRPGDPVQFVVTKTNETSLYSWDFGDESTAKGSSVVHYYYDEGLFDVSLFVESENACSATTTKQSYISVNENNTGLAVEDNSPMSVLIYPNPVTDKLTIETWDNLNISGTSITLYSINGKVIRKEKMLSVVTEINLSSVMPGIYILEIKSDDFTINKKITRE